ncbi:MAG: Asp-tRNA(Asn)/Glu-tRNA(Gln) amidotransferase subunit GatC [Clostridiales bacterium]|nr:Asp-tRNA(Asn)/Glu-tRNA(Gln) amidotransferase subunit GatC [Clostridiales bacterium]
MKIDNELIKYLESLARITLEPDEEKAISSELQEILTYIDMLGELDTDSAEAMSHCLPITNVFRKDIPAPSLTPAEITANAPESQDGLFVVPKTVD